VLHAPAAAGRADDGLVRALHAVEHRLTAHARCHEGSPATGRPHCSRRQGA
jgi:hypothetical protein